MLVKCFSTFLWDRLSGRSIIYILSSSIIFILVVSYSSIFVIIYIFCVLIYYIIWLSLFFFLLCVVYCSPFYFILLLLLFSFLYFFFKLLWNILYKVFIEINSLSLQKKIRSTYILLFFFIRFHLLNYTMYIIVAHVTSHVN